MMPPSGMPRPDEPTERAFVAWLGGELDRAFDARPESGPDRNLSSLEPHRIPERDPRPAVARHRRVGLSAGGRLELWLRQYRRRAASLAVADGPIPVRAQDHRSHGGRRAAAGDRRRELPDRARFPAERPRRRICRSARAAAPLSRICSRRMPSTTSRSKSLARRVRAEHTARGDGRRCAGQDVRRSRRPRRRDPEGAYANEARQAGTAGAGHRRAARSGRRLSTESPRISSSRCASHSRIRASPATTAASAVAADGHECLGRRARTTRPARATRRAAAASSSVSRRASARRKRRAPGRIIDAAGASRLSRHRRDRGHRDPAGLLQ